MSDDGTEQFERALINAAKKGDDEAGRGVLNQIVSAVTAGRFNSPVFPYLAECLSLFLEDGVPLERALCVEVEGKDGRPPYDAIELTAVYILLTEYGGKPVEQAIRWIMDAVGCSRDTVIRCRKHCRSRYNKSGVPLMEALSREDLLELSDRLREGVAQALSGVA
jgi:hypothetical protein